MDFREYEITRDGDEVVVSGTIREPVNWDFTIRISGDDIPGMLRLGLHRHTLAMAVRWAFRRPAKGASVPEASPDTTRSRAPAEPARSVTTSPAAEPLRVAPKPAPVVVPQPVPVAVPPADESRSIPSAKTPDFGAPRRRGAANGSSEAQSTATDSIAEGGRR